jgi:hypothetical protein
MAGRWRGSSVKQVSKDSRRVHPINRKTSGQIIREEIVRGFQEQARLQELERTRLKVAHQARAAAITQQSINSTAVKPATKPMNFTSGIASHGKQILVHYSDAERKARCEAWMNSMAT